MKHLFRIFAILALTTMMILFARISADAKIYKYQRPDGVWVFTNDPQELPEGADVTALTGSNPGPERSIDLAATLEDRIKPRNSIERASLATVAVKSGLGQGSGFFVTDQGHLLTNRHVIRTSKMHREQHETRRDHIEIEIKQQREKIETEQQRIWKGMQDLESRKGRLYPRSYAEGKAHFESWQKDLDRREADFERDVRKVQEEIDDQDYRNRMKDLDRSFTIVLADGTELRANLIAVSDQLDLALLKLDGYRTPRLNPANPANTATGDRVYAIGNPAALHNSVSEGILSGYERGFIKTDAKIYPGNSGGPLLAASGRVLGINTFKKLTYRFEGLGFAIPLYAALKEFERYLPDIESLYK